ncbi:acyl-ACP--UDP-N-acetylglucosamine O-acyltransferase [Thiotrichales bacterium 19S9-12]|nr:acyl-ACP--UDP-N-acetylglucosamine O-acyltransferase [Thiotrichales bacterium 19S9-11]MCF6812185.1 acyl-ACP--UDP-N-acetylglucosamine O-acyltransferase [Thiotrichales bacterium 19S9-12]
MIDPKAVIYEGASIAPDVDIGPYAVIGPKVTIGSGTKIGPHVVIQNTTTIGKNNQIFQFASIGADPIDHSYQGEETYLEIGDGNIIREGATIHGGTSKETNTTKVGNNNLIMNYVHIGHDCVIGSHVTLVNYSAIAGHVRIHDYATIGVYSGIHQFVTIGAYSFIAQGALIGQDVLPYLVVIPGKDKPATPLGLNTEGLKRNGFSKETIADIKKAYKIIYRQGLKLEEAVEKLKELEIDCPEVDIMRKMLEKTERGITR